MYFYIEDNEIIGVGSAECLTESVLSIPVSSEIYAAWKNDNDKVIYDGTDIIVNPDYEEIKQQKETARINNLTMTALDFINVVKSLGLTDEDIDEYLQANIPLKNQLTYCQNVFCGVVRNLVPLEVKGKTITDAMVVNAFKVKNGENPDIV